MHEADIALSANLGPCERRASLPNTPSRRDRDSARALDTLVLQAVVYYPDEVGYKPGASDALGENPCVPQECFLSYARVVAKLGAFNGVGSEEGA